MIEVPMYTLNSKACFSSEASNLLVEPPTHQVCVLTLNPNQLYSPTLNPNQVYVPTLNRLFPNPEPTRCISQP